MKPVLLSILLTTLLAAEEVPQHIIDTGERISTSLLKHLGGKLKHEIKTNGILAAAKFCNHNALTLTEEVNLNQIEGHSVKRISLQERNMANTPTKDEAEVLQAMQTMLDQDDLPPFIVQKVNKSYKYYKPLVITKGVCLKCHGDISKNQELSNFMQEHYPDDKALGYKMGDLRGAVLVEMKE